MEETKVPAGVPLELVRLVIHEPTLECEHFTVVFTWLDSKGKEAIACSALDSYLFAELLRPLSVRQDFGISESCQVRLVGMQAGGGV